MKLLISIGIYLMINYLNIISQREYKQLSELEKNTVN